MERYLESMYSIDFIFGSNNKKPLFENKTPHDNKGTYVLIGTDHGQGTAQFMLRILLGSSKLRRDHDRPDFNTRTISFANIKCKKDPYSILKLTKDEVNECILELSSKKMVAFTDATNQIRCIFIQKEMNHYTFKDGNFVCKKGRLTHTYPIPKDLKDVVCYRIITSSSHVLQIGDLAAQMALQGREGMASSRCIKCNLTQSEWKAGLGSSLIDIGDINTISPNFHIGQKLPALWNICPTDTVVPILHCEIGTVNDQLFKKLFRSILSIETGNEEETKNRIELNKKQDSIDMLIDTAEHMSTDLYVYRYRNLPIRSNHVRIRNNLNSRLRNSKRKNKEGSDAIEKSIEASLILNKKDIEAIDDVISSLTIDLDSLTKTIDDESKSISKLKSDIDSVQWERRKEEVSIHTQIERVFQKHKVTIQAYHGGSLTGGAILVLLNKHESIMGDITRICHQKINDRLLDNSELHPPCIESFTLLLLQHGRLFCAQDGVYAHLRLIDPSIEEMRQTRERIEIMRIQWEEMGLSVTPKAHLIFEHAADDQERLGGLGDKIEDPLEKRHQEQMQYDAMLNRMPCGFETKRKTQLKYEWRNSNPLVIEQIKKVKELTSRNNCTLKSQAPIYKKDTVKQERHDARIRYMDDIKDATIE